MVLFKKQPFSLGFRRFSRKKDLWGKNGNGSYPWKTAGRRMFLLSPSRLHAQLLALSRLGLHFGASEPLGWEGG